MKLATATASAQDGSAPVSVETRGARTAKHAVIAFWVVVLALLLRHREVISSDTLSNYVHVWFVADQVWHGHGDTRCRRGSSATAQGTGWGVLRARYARVK